MIFWSASKNDVKLSRSLFCIQINIIEYWQHTRSPEYAEGRTIGAQGKGLLFLKYLCVCHGKRKYCMGLDTVGCDRIYVPAKGRIENTGGSSPLSAESIFLIYHRQLFFDIAPYGEHRHIWLTRVSWTSLSIIDIKIIWKRILDHLYWDTFFVFSNAFQDKKQMFKMNKMRQIHC